MSCEGAVELSSTEAAGAKTFINQLVKELGRIKLEPLAVLVESHHFARVRGNPALHPHEASKAGKSGKSIGTHSASLWQQAGVAVVKYDRSQKWSLTEQMKLEEQV